MWREPNPWIGRLPDWAVVCSTRVRKGLEDVFRDPEKLREVTPDEVREYGFEHWRRVPGMGRKSLKELELLIGGWE